MNLSLICVAKRLLVSAGELAVLTSLLVLSSILASVVAVANGCYTAVDCGPAEAADILGWLLSVVGFVALRRKTRRWKIEYDAAGWALAQTERKLHPARARYKRIVKRILIWVPSALAALVLFFFPEVSHLRHPLSGFVKHYRIPIPWSFTVFSYQDPTLDSSWVWAFCRSCNKKFDAMPFSQSEPSFMTFGSIRSDADTEMSQFNHLLQEERRRGATQVLSRDFQIADTAVTCRQYVTQDQKHYGSLPFWEVDCETPPEMHVRNLYASFLGREEDIPAFYRILENIAPVK